MVDTDTFLTTLDVMVDEICQSQLPAESHRGPQAALTRRAGVALGLVGLWACFPSERAFYRDAQRHLRAACPTLPHRPQCNRLLRRHYEAIIGCFWHLADLLRGHHGLYEALESSAGPTREAKRRGAGGLPGLADIGWSHRLGWDEGFHRRIAVTPPGVITGFGLGPASARDQPWAQTFLALRRQPHPRWRSVGRPALGPYVCDKGFEGLAAPARWWHAYGAQVMGPPKRHSRQPWSTQARRWLAGVRQSIETVDDKVHHTFGLSRERPHALTGFQARLAAKLALHHCCVWRNEPLDRPPRAFADLVDWEHGPYLTPSV